jgi:hypothetical protein
MLQPPCSGLHSYTDEDYCIVVETFILINKMTSEVNRAMSTDPRRLGVLG